MMHLSSTFLNLSAKKWSGASWSSPCICTSPPQYKLTVSLLTNQKCWKGNNPTKVPMEWHTPDICISHPLHLFSPWCLFSPQQLEPVLTYSSNHSSDLRTNQAAESERSSTWPWQFPQLSAIMKGFLHSWERLKSHMYCWEIFWWARSRTV